MRIFFRKTVERKGKAFFARLLKILIWRLRAYKAAYKLSYYIFLFRKSAGSIAESKDEYDIVFALDKGNRGWILERICKEISREYMNPCFSYGHYFLTSNILPENEYLPEAKAYFFEHYSNLVTCYRTINSALDSKKCYIFYTHQSEKIPRTNLSVGEMVYVMNRCKKVICMNSQAVEFLKKKGVKAGKLTYVIGAANPNVFMPHERTGKGKIGFCSSYNPRKNGNLLFEIVRAMPHREFILIGNKWERYGGMEELLRLSNFAYIQAPYREYREYYNKVDVFVSPSKKEGGPIPLLEAMMCNAVPVATKTGFAPDIIRDGDNGFLFDADSPLKQICGLIDRAYELRANIRETVLNFTWENFAQRIKAILDESK